MPKIDEMAPMYYVIKTEYVGPNADDDKYADADRIRISSAPARCNRKPYDPCVEGWCGTNYDWATFAHGEYDSLEAAQAAVAQKFGDVRLSDPDWTDDNDVIEVYRPGRYAPMGRQSTEDWAYQGIEEDVTAVTTNEEIDDLAAEYESVANNETGCTLDLAALTRAMRRHRQELLDAAAAEAAERDDD